jgi:methyl-accepting chemotaxis protein
MAKEISKGDLSRDIYLKPKDNDSVLHSVKQMQQELLERRTKEYKAADEILRIKIGLDNAQKGIMMADNDRNIFYLNEAAKKILRVYATEIEGKSKQFDVENLIGLNIDIFHKNSAHQMKLLDSMEESIFSYAKLGSRTMTVIASPILTEANQRLGTIAEWYDYTAEVIVEQEVSQIVKAASLGDFSQRFNLEGKEGFLLELAQGLNTLLSNSQSSLDDIAHVLAAISQGDLTQTITNDYAGTLGQLKDDTNLTVEKLKDLVEQIKLATDNIYDGSKEIASGNNDLSRRTETQSAHLEKTAASMVQFTNVVKSNANNAKRADELVINAVDIATQGGLVVQNVIQTMSNINESSHRIEDIISVIDDIAFQTNILALNAAVEAARAGEQGKGFAVVAVEVRNLAQRSAIAADEIKRLIADSVMQVSDGSQLVAKAGDTMNQIIEAIQGVTKIMTEINGASAQQNEDIGQVSKAINEMEAVTQQNAALVEESAAAAESLEEQAENLAAVIGSFRI